MPRRAGREGASTCPLWISVTIVDLSGRTLSGQTLEAFWASIEHADPFIVGVNCSLGAKEIRQHVEELARLADCYTSVHPNAGLPNPFGDYEEGPETTSALLREFAESGLVNVVGGCCGTTPDHTQGHRRRRRGAAAARGARAPAADAVQRPRALLRSPRTRTSSWSGSART